MPAWSVPTFGTYHSSDVGKIVFQSAQPRRGKLAPPYLTNQERQRILRLARLGKRRAGHATTKAATMKYMRIESRSCITVAKGTLLLV